MTLTNRDVFLRDPSASKIPNDGVAKVVRPEDEKQWDVLRWELKSFVCEGQYEKCLERILDSFLRNLDSEQQPAVWVSGFYGSGKSHLVRVLEHLWRDLWCFAGHHRPGCHGRHRLGGIGRNPVGVAVRPCAPRRKAGALERRRVHR